MAQEPKCAREPGHLVVALPRLFPTRRAGAQPPTPPDPSAQGRPPSVSPGPTSAPRFRLFVQPSTRHPAPPPPYDRVTRAPDGSERARGGPCPPAPSMAPSLSVRPGRTPRDSVLCAPPPSRLRASLLSWHVLGGPRSLRALSAGGPQLTGLPDPRPWSQSLPLTAVTSPRPLVLWSRRSSPSPGQKGRGSSGRSALSICGVHAQLSRPRQTQGLVSWRRAGHPGWLRAAWGTDLVGSLSLAQGSPGAGARGRGCF